MYYELGANLTFVVHLAFIVFVIFGSLLLFASKKIAFLHIPSVIYVTYIELSHSICPLTYIENWFLNKGNMKNYPSSFIEQYLIPIVYPNNLTTELQFFLGLLLILINVVIYILAIKFFKLV